MKIILDEGVPAQLARSLPGHYVATVVDLGWASVENGQLLALIERESFRAFITCDKNMQFQQPLHKRPFSILPLSTNHWPSIAPLVDKIAEALESAEPGAVTQVECGRFVASKRRRRSGL